MTDFQTKQTFLEHLMCKCVNKIMLRVRSLSQISEPNSRVQAAGRYENLEAKPSRKKLRGFVIKKKTKNTWIFFCTFFRAI